MICKLCGKETEGRFCKYCGYEDKENEDPRHLKVGTRLGGDRYVVGNTVGAGGFGVTYSAWDRVLNKRVAVKEYMPGEFSTRAEGTQTVSIYGGEKEEQFKNGLDKFFEESRRLAKFSDVPGIVQIYDCFMENNTAYIIMEYLEGETLGDRIKREGKIPCREAVDIMIPVLEALSKVHEEGIIHRDIAPNNIFLTSDGRVKLLDFGAARSATGTHSKSLTVLYKEGFTAEEQYRSRGDQGPWTDVYAAAATLYKAITGKTPEGAMERRVKDTLKAPGKCGVKVPATVDAAILNAMNIDIKKRTKSAEDFRTELLGTRKVKKHFQRTSEKKTGHIPAAVFVISGCFLAVAATLLILLKTGVIEFHAEFFDNLFLEAGKSRVMNVVNMDSEEAGRRLENIGLKMEVTDYRYDNSVQVGRIISQEEEKGSVVNEGTVIHVVVSHEAEEVTIPDMEELTEEAAMQMLEELCLEVEKVTEEGALLPGRVLRSSPSAGSVLLQGSAVKLYVSEGLKYDEKSECTLEDYSGKSFGSVRRQLAKSGIYVVRGEERYDDEIPKNTIVSQSVSAGEVAHGGDVITLDISLGIEQKEVPELLGQKREDAEKLLEELDLKADVEVVVDREAEEGIVLTQDTKAGEKVDKYSEIHLTVSTKGFQVPSLIGLSREAAESICAQNGFGISITEVRGGDGTMVSQSPAAGEYVVAKGTINVKLGIPEDQYRRAQEDKIIADCNAFLAGYGVAGVYRTDQANTVAQRIADFVGANRTAPDWSYVRQYYGGSIYYVYSTYGSLGAYSVGDLYAGAQIGFGYVGNELRVIVELY